MIVYDKLINLFGRIMGDDFDLKTINEKTDLFQDLGVNSITMLMMGIAIEEEFGIQLSTNDVSECKTVGDIVDVIKKTTK
ncbi:acyl carrier protein [Acholeplasma sp. OttesenSCG-928-E16]|nr:acyl carrier protein [Acholeplasma sp. OttesenSCG-928-E16]